MAATSSMRTEVECPGLRQVTFSIATARRALPYMARIVEDLSSAFLAAQQNVKRRKQCRSVTERTQLDALFEQDMRRFNGAADEYTAIGADLPDLALGVVRIPSEINGRPLSLIWRLGEPIEGRWRELQELGG